MVHLLILSVQQRQTGKMTKPVPPLANTRDRHPMWDQRWASVYDAGPTLIPHRVDVLCLLTAGKTTGHACSRKTNLVFMQKIYI